MKSKTHRPCRCGCGTIIPYTLNPYATIECKKRDGWVAPSKARTPISRASNQLKRTPLKPNTKPIAKRAKKAAKYDRQYTIVKLQVLAEAKYICFIEGCTRKADTIEHQRGRQWNIYFDDWARENDIPLLIDKRWLKPCCAFHNGELERNTELSHKYQLSKIHHGTKGETKN